MEASSIEVGLARIGMVLKMGLERPSVATDRWRYLALDCTDPSSLGVKGSPRGLGFLWGCARIIVQKVIS